MYSLHPTKCLSAGEGGVVATDRADLARKIGSIYNDNKVPFCFSDLQAALASSQLARYEQVLRRRAEIAELYLALIPKVYTQPLTEVGTQSMFFRFPLHYRGNFL